MGSAPPQRGWRLLEGRCIVIGNRLFQVKVRKTPNQWLVKPEDTVI